ncbi:protein FAR-RED IMPAIRED RESPONSE 1-like [Arachis stenosperma]|uniref:protein FAR-RED IMPAIRED RESPONSE 1-like n=1 Tax=Arachis stenosperma TaxID=217475 RepID=UPI0025AD46DD|nr:protein FAR-RED IMPAIRED RESPONSE 1-like [Arachis stenosperma]
MLKQHRELSMFVRHTIENNEEAEIRPSKTYQSFVAVTGNHWELSFIEKDVRNYITREVQNVSEQDDAKEFGKYLLRMKEKNQNFFFELNLEGDHSIKNALWANARSRTACEYFGDVVSFDTTYNINRRKSPRPVDTSRMHSYEKRGHPIIQMAIRVLALLHGREGTKRHSCRPMRIDAKGHRDVHANNNSPVVHLAGMKSTQRIESMHTFFNKFITQNSSLIQFVKQYDNCLASSEQREREFDVVDFHTMIPCATKSAIEAQFQHVYTYEKFRKVQEQLRGNVSCIIRLMHSTLGFMTYEVIEQVSNTTFNKFFVTYNAVSREVKC